LEFTHIDAEHQELSGQSSLSELLGLSTCEVCGSIVPNPSAFDETIYRQKYNNHTGTSVHRAYEQIHAKYAQLLKVYSLGEMRKKKAGAGSSNTKRKQ
jgi:hypothetical protein